MRLPVFGSVTAVRALAVITLVIFVSQLAVILIVWRQAQTRAGTEYRLPLPGRVASIVTVVESTPPEERRLVLQALNSRNLAVRVEDALNGIDRQDTRQLPAYRRAIDRYAEVLDGREVIGMIGLGPHRMMDLREGEDSIEAGFPMRLLIELKGGEWLVIETPDILAVRLRRLPFGILGVLAGTIVAALAVWSIWQEVRPVRDMAKAAHSFADTGKPSLIVPAGGHDVRELAKSFNDMQERIAALIANRTLVMSAMTHDVRTYLTRLRLRIEALEPDSRDAAERTLSDIQALLDDTLAFAEAGTSTEFSEKVDIARLLESIMETGQFPEEKVRFEFAGRPVIVGHSGRLQRAFVNLISNAVKYGSEADIRLALSGNMARIEIADRGPGIPEEDRHRVFDPFYRRDASRNRNIEGAGLGLAIASNIIRNHGGRISLQDRSGGGLVAVVELRCDPVA
jgi:signal transduction histidine kinase